SLLVAGPPARQKNCGTVSHAVSLPKRTNRTLCGAVEVFSPLRCSRSKQILGAAKWPDCSYESHLLGDARGEVRRHDKLKAGNSIYEPGRHYICLTQEDWQALVPPDPKGKRPAEGNGSTG